MRVCSAGIKIEKDKEYHTLVKPEDVKPEDVKPEDVILIAGVRELAWLRLANQSASREIAPI
eukprot:5088476-Prymnesium_polylepis.1